MKLNFSEFILCNYCNSLLLLQFFVLGNNVNPQKIKTLKDCFNTPVYKASGLSHNLTYFSFAYSEQRGSEKKSEAHLQNDLCFEKIQNLLPLRKDSRR